MDCSCNCFGIASSSRFPVKRYNLLVPDIFPEKQPEVSEKVDASTERKYKKLYDYIAKNPHRGPKASRRLARKAHKELQSRNFGYVQVAAQAFVYQLQHLPAEDSNLFARELVAQNVDREKGRLTEDPSKAVESVIGVLLQSQNLEACIWGAQAFAAYVHTQGSLEFATQLQVLLRLLLRLLLPCVSLSGASLSTVGGGDPGKADLVRLQVAALQAVREFIIYSGRVYASRESQREAAECVMDLLMNQTAPGAPLPCRSPLPEDADVPLGEQQGKQQPVRAALSCMDALFDLCQNAVEGREVIMSVLAFMDERKVWKTQPEAYTLAIRRLQQVCQREGQDSMVLSILLRHLRGLPEGAPQQTMLLHEAARQASGLPSTFAIPALISALQELPGAMPAGGAQAASAGAASPEVDTGGARQQSLALITGLAGQVGSSGLVLEVLGGVCTRFAQEDAARGNALACFHAALQGASKAPHAQGVNFPQQLTEFLAAAMADHSAAQRASAHSLGTTALQLTDGQLPDRQSALLLTAAWQEAAMPGGTPPNAASLDALLEGVIRTAGTPANIRALQWALSARHQILAQAGGGHFRASGAAQQLVLLYVYNALLLRLAVALGTRKLPELLLHLIASECPCIRLTNHGLDLTAEDARFDTADESAAAKVLQRLRSEEASDGSTATKASGAVADSSAIRGHPQAQVLVEQLRQPFDAAAGNPASKADSKEAQAQLVKRLEAIFPKSAVSQERQAPPAATPAPAPPKAGDQAQSQLSPEEGASNAAMTDLLSALDKAMQNGADETDLTGMAPHVRHPRLTAASAAQHDGLRVGAAS